MSRQLGATYTLSILVVVFCAIAFYRAEKPQGRPGRPAVARAEKAHPSAGRDSGAKEAAPGPARVVAERRPPQPESRPAPVALAEPGRPEVAIPVVRRVVRRQAGPKEDFARVDEGETLADVAFRVYGSAEKAGALWKANRDQLPRPEAPLGAGMLLRTP